MNKLSNQISFFTNLKTLIKDNFRNIIIFIFILLLFFIGQQVYSFINNQKILISAAVYFNNVRLIDNFIYSAT